jgi:ATP-dependent RNA helicase DeaD
MNNFKSFSLPESLEKAMETLKFDKPTDVQIKAIPHALAGKDVIVSAPTGTGKTLAFCVPIVAKLISDPDFKAAVITPTRELATQIITVLHSLLINNKEVKTALLIGGTPMNKQLSQLKNKVRLVVGTPGRINDHLGRKTLKLGGFGLVVLDEMDRMLDMGFSIQIDEIFKFMPKDKQVLLYSATIVPAIKKTAEKYLNNPESISIDAGEIVNTKIKQEFVHVAKADKYKELLAQIEKCDGTIIIFSKTKKNTDDLAKKLFKDGFHAKAIHGDLRQHTREKIVRQFRKEEFDIVVATDVASRGIDVPHIKLVINYNLPQVAEDYVHRVGRTGRAGKEGNAVTLVSPDERKEWNQLECFLDPSKKPERRSGGGQNRRPSKKFGGGGNRRSEGSNRGGDSRRSEGSRGNGGGFDRKPSGDRKPGSSRGQGEDRRRSDNNSDEGSSGGRSGFGRFFGKKPTGDKREGDSRGERKPRGFGNSERSGGDRRSDDSRGESKPRRFGNDSKPGGDRDRRRDDSREDSKPRRFGNDSKPGDERGSKPGEKRFGKPSSRPSGDRKPLGPRKFSKKKES